MYWYDSTFIGMSFLWWVFWVIVLVAFFSLLTPIPRSRVRNYEQPLETLRRRYAAGEITTEEYEDRKARLLADTPETGARGAQPERRRFDRRQTV
jgi:putative membrane protein